MIPHKNIGPFLAFTSEWFNQRQEILLWLLNAPCIKYLSRWIMRIRSYDCPPGIRITRIGPNYFSYDQEDGQITTDFRTHPKYAKRIYYAFRPIWWVCHFWDWMVADRFVPDWSFGFGSLTAYPDPGTGLTTVDGNVGTYNTDDNNWATERAKANGDNVDTDTADTLVVQCETLGLYSIFRRAAFLFDTHDLTSDANISAATFYIMGTDTSYNLTESTYPADLCLVSCNPGSLNTLVVADYNINNWGSTPFATNVTIANFYANRDNYSTFALNSSGIANISKTGVSKFGIRGANDVNNTPPTARSYCSGYYADQAATTQDPKLVITYTVSSFSPSISPSESPSVSPSVSLSPSISPSPSPGWKNYSRGNYASLPRFDADLSTYYSAEDVTNVGSTNGVRVDQAATGEYAIHQFKNYATANSVTINCVGRSDIDCADSTIYLEIYNRTGSVWDSLDSNTVTPAGSDFTFTKNVPDLTAYKDDSNVITCRVYQKAQEGP